MSKYTVTIEVYGTYSVEFEAENFDEAYEKARCLPSIDVGDQLYVSEEKVIYMENEETGEQKECY